MCEIQPSKLMSHQEMPFQKLVKELRPEGSANLSPLFQVMFELRNLPKVPTQQSGGLRMETVPFNPDFIGALDLVLEVLENPDGSELYLQICSRAISARHHQADERSFPCCSAAHRRQSKSATFESSA